MKKNTATKTNTYEVCLCTNDDEEYVEITCETFDFRDGYSPEIYANGAKIEFRSSEHIISIENLTTGETIYENFDDEDDEDD